MEKKVALDEAKVLMDEESKQIEVYKLQLERLLTSKPVSLTSFIYDSEEMDLSFARQQAFNMADSAMEDLQDNIDFFEQERKNAKKEAVKLSEKLKKLDGQLTTLNNGRPSRQRVGIQERRQLDGQKRDLMVQLTAQKSIMADWDIKIQELEAKKPKLIGMRKVLKQAVNGKFTTNNKPKSGFFNWVFGT